MSKRAELAAKIAVLEREYAAASEACLPWHVVTPAEGRRRERARQQAQAALSAANKEAARLEKEEAEQERVAEEDRAALDALLSAMPEPTPRDEDELDRLLEDMELVFGERAHVGTNGLIPEAE